MKYFTSILFLYLFSSSIAVAQKSIPELKIIKPELVKGAHTLIREDQYVVEILSESEFTTTVFFRATILNEHSPYTTAAVRYDKDRKITSFKGRLYDPDGKLIKKLGKNEIVDQSAISSGTIYQDSRVQMLRFNYHSYPYTIEYSYTTTDVGILDLPDFGIQGYKVGLENFSNTLIAPLDYEFHFQSENIESEPAVSQINGKRKYEWIIKDLKPIIPERHSPHSSEILPKIAIAPAIISYENWKGSFSDWNKYGKFSYDLNKDRDALSNETKKKIISLTEVAASDEDKIKILYKYLQENTRYVSIQLGIGGYQTFDANYVERNKYGDCKALTNFMKAMLRHIEIPAHTAIIYAGDDATFKVDESFANSFGNHVILYLPNQDKYLECTSSNGPPFYVGSFTQDRSTLITTAEGGFLQVTPTLTEAENLIKRTVKVTLAENGAADISAKIQYHGAPHELYRQLEHQYDQKKQEKIFSQYTSKLPNNSLKTFGIESDPDHPTATITLTAAIPYFSNAAGNRLFIEPNFISSLPVIPEEMEDRKNDFVLRTAQTESDEIVIDLPKAIQLESKANHSLEKSSAFGSLSQELSYSDGQLIFKQTLVRNAFRGGPEQYEKYRQWLLELQQEWSPRIVFKKAARP